jgi:hypothetical protein
MGLGGGWDLLSSAVFKVRAVRSSGVTAGAGGWMPFSRVGIAVLVAVLEDVAFL